MEAQSGNIIIVRQKRTKLILAKSMFNIKIPSQKLTIAEIFLGS